MPTSLAEFIHHGNMRHYTKELSTAASGPRRVMLLSLIAAETTRADKAGWVTRYDWR